MNSGTARQSTQIGRKPAANVHHAFRFANTIGCPLNYFVTINFALTPCPAQRTSAAFRRLLCSWFARWLRRHPKNKAKCPPTYAYAVETANGQTHVHWAVHIPRGFVREFRRILPQWIEAVAGGPMHAPSAVKHRRVYNPVGLKRYMLKGMDPLFARLWQIRPVDQGLVIGRRSGFSRNLGPTRRHAAGYRSTRRSAGGWSAGSASA